MRFKKRSVCWLALMCMTVGRPGQSQKLPHQENWTDYGGGVDALQYSPLQQINRTNVNQLTQAWFYSVPGVSARFSYSPLIVDGKMYVLGSGKTIVCLDAATGKEIWSHPTEGTPTDRGINYWESSDRKDRRLIFAADSYSAGDRRPDRRVDPQLWHRWAGQFARGARPRPQDHSRDSNRHTRTRLREHDHPGFRYQRILRFTAG